MINRIRVVKVPEAGYLVIGEGTYSLDDEIDISAPFLDPEEVGILLKADYIVLAGELPRPEVEEN